MVRMDARYRWILILYRRDGGKWCEREIRQDTAGMTLAPENLPTYSVLGQRLPPSLPTEGDLRSWPRSSAVNA